jgi:hypothetical protein
MVRVWETELRSRAWKSGGKQSQETEPGNRARKRSQGKEPEN